MELLNHTNLMFIDYFLLRYFQCSIVYLSTSKFLKPERLYDPGGFQNCSGAIRTFSMWWVVSASVLKSNDLRQSSSVFVIT